MSRVVGGAQTLSKMRSRFPSAYPESLWFAHDGVSVVSPQGDIYVDWIASLGAISLGYNDPEVDDAVKHQVSKGPIFSLPDTRLEESVAEKLCDLIPCAEAVRFVKTGSEATEAAIRVARAYTGREVVLQCGYHCYSDDTEILTPDGFKRFKDVRVNDLVATRNPDTREMQYQYVDEVVDAPYS